MKKVTVKKITVRKTPKRMMEDSEMDGHRMEKGHKMINKKRK